VAKDKLKKRVFPSNISTTVSSFDLNDLQLLKISFQPTPFKSNILPNVDADGFPEEYILPNISKKELLDKNLISKALKNLRSDKGMEEAKTDALIVIYNAYSKEFDYGLPQKKLITIKRWPEGVHQTSGLDVVEPSGRQNILKAFFKIRKHLLQ
ncbi:16572_t:CDS:2, partial [Dentiscutata erythropus]